MTNTMPIATSEWAKYEVLVASTRKYDVWRIGSPTGFVDRQLKAPQPQTRKNETKLSWALFSPAVYTSQAWLGDPQRGVGGN